MGKQPPTRFYQDQDTLQAGGLLRGIHRFSLSRRRHRSTQVVSSYLISIPIAMSKTSFIRQCTHSLNGTSFFDQSLLQSSDLLHHLVFPMPSTSLHF